MLGRMDCSFPTLTLLIYTVFTKSFSSNFEDQPVLELIAESSRTGCWKRCHKAVLVISTNCKCLRVSNCEQA
jgi:hypothetical protein